MITPEEVWENFQSSKDFKLNVNYTKIIEQLCNEMNEKETQLNNDRIFQQERNRVHYKTRW